MCGYAVAQRGADATAARASGVVCQGKTAGANVVQDERNKNVTKVLCLNCCQNQSWLGGARFAVELRALGQGVGSDFRRRGRAQ